MSRPKGISWDDVDFDSGTDKQIAERLGVSCAAVQSARARRGVRRCNGWRAPVTRDRPATCERCGDAAVDRYRGEYLCRECLIDNDDSDLDVCNYVHTDSPLASAQEEAGGVDSDPGRKFYDQVDDAYRRVVGKQKNGISYLFRTRREESRA